MKNRVVRTEKVNMMFELTHRVQGHCESENKNSPVKNTEESLLVGKIPMEANGFDSFVGRSDTNIAHELTYRNLNLYRQLEKDLLTLDDFANYAWVVARLKIRGK